MTEKELKNRCTPEFIEWCVNLAEGFGMFSNLERNMFIIKYEYMEWMFLKDDLVFHKILFPLLIHRAVEGINNEKYEKEIDLGSGGYISIKGSVSFKPFFLKDYQPDILTAGECAILDCLLAIFKEQ